MKRITITTIIVLVSLMEMLGQSTKRLVLLEEFTNTGCAPCARFAPTLDSLLMVRLGDVVSVKYHFYYPDVNDPFYLQDKENLKERGEFYDITGVPSVLIDGIQYSASASVISDKIDQLKQENPSFNFNITSTIQEHTLELHVDYTPLLKMNNENLRLFVAVVEEEINLETPSPNGETHYINTVRKLLPNAKGYSIPHDLEKDKTYSYQTNWDIKGFYNEKELGLIAFIQDISTKEILGTVYAPRTTDQNEAAKVILVQNTPDKICAPHYTAKIMFRNMGKNNITNAKINVEINGKAQTTDWQGNLAYLETATLTTPDFTTYDLNETKKKNSVDIYVSNINGTSAESEKYHLEFSNAITAKESVQLTLFTDKKPEETTWKLFNSAGDVVDEGGPYEEARTFQKHFLNIDVDDCYELEFYDVAGNGITGENGNGYYKLEEYTSDGKHKMFLQGDYAGATHDVFFKIVHANPGANIQNFKTGSKCNYDMENSILEVKTQEMTHLNITDITGRSILTLQIADGKTISLADYPQGIYIIRLQAGKNIQTQKITLK